MWKVGFFELNYARHLWCVKRRDDRVGGVFASREAALKFIRQEQEHSASRGV